MQEHDWEGRITLTATATCVSCFVFMKTLQRPCLRLTSRSTETSNSADDTLSIHTCILRDTSRVYATTRTKQGSRCTRLSVPGYEMF